MIRRRARERGFSLIEATVALTIAAMTLLLLAGAGFGLRLAAERTARTQDIAVDLLAARRAIRRWASEVSTDGTADAPELSFAGLPDRVAMLLAPDPGSAQGDRLALLEVVRGETGDVLLARRQRGSRSLLTGIERADSSALLATGRRLSFAYLFTGGRNEDAWLATTTELARLPRAVALLIDGDRAILARLPQELDPLCIGRVGAVAFEGSRCALR